MCLKHLNLFYYITYNNKNFKVKFIYLLVLFRTIVIIFLYFADKNCLICSYYFLWELKRGLVYGFFRVFYYFFKMNVRNCYRTCSGWHLNLFGRFFVFYYFTVVKSRVWCGFLCWRGRRLNIKHHLKAFLDFILIVSSCHMTYYQKLSYDETRYFLLIFSFISTMDFSDRYWIRNCYISWLLTFQFTLQRCELIF